MQYKLPVGNSGCGASTLADLQKNATARTAEEIAAVVTAKNKLNKGLYARALMLKKESGLQLRVPLYLLSPFFNLPEFLWPGKRLMNIELKLNSPSRNIIKEASMTDAYDIQISSTQLDISYCILEESLRRSWYSLIEEQRLIRSFDSIRETHFPMPKSSSVYFIPNCTAFGVSPRYLTIFFNEMDIHTGCYKNKYRYSHENIKSLQVFINGSGHYLNQRMRNLSLTSMEHPDVYFFYERFLLMYPEKARSVSLKQFHSDFFLFVVDISPIDYAADKSALSLVTSSSIDISIEFHSENTKNLVCYVHANHKAIVEMSVSGEILENE